MMPSNHRLAERTIIVAVQNGEWEIDQEGRIWRVAVRTGNRWNPGDYRLTACQRRRVEKRLNSGYLMVRMMIAGRRHSGLAHRLVWQHMNGDIPEGLVVNHKNGQKDDNRPANLEIVTYSRNMKHAYRIGLIDEHGERNPASHLNDRAVAEIRRAYAMGDVTMAILASRFDCSVQHVSKLIRGHRRAKQDGPTADVEHRHTSTRDPDTGRFVSPKVRA